MKFEQAMRAMRRGEKVRRKTWPKGQFLSYRENTFVTSSGTHNAIEFGKDAFNDVGWVILRKKKKAKPALRDVFKDPRVGDVIGRKKTDERGYLMTWAVVYVTPKSVRFVDSYGDVGEQSRDGWASSNSYTVIHRAEG